MSKPTLEIRVLAGMDDIPAATWDACANPQLQPISEEKCAL